MRPPDDTKKHEERRALPKMRPDQSERSEGSDAGRGASLARGTRGGAETLHSPQTPLITGTELKAKFDRVTYQRDYMRRYRANRAKP